MSGSVSPCLVGTGILSKLRIPNKPIKKVPTFILALSHLHLLKIIHPLI